MDRKAVVRVLNKCRSMFNRPGVRFDLSPWSSASEADEQLSYLIKQVDAGQINHKPLCDLFGPFGPIHHVAMLSDWVPQFLQLAARVDEAVYPDITVKQTG